MIFMGDDWPEDHHDVYVMDQAGKRLASRRLPESFLLNETSHSALPSTPGGMRHSPRALVTPSPEPSSRPFPAGSASH
jgi:hypothetical protein